MGAQGSAVVDVSHPVKVELETLLLELCQMSIVTHFILIALSQIP